MHSEHEQQAESYPDKFKAFSSLDTKRELTKFVQLALRVNKIENVPDCSAIVVQENTWNFKIWINIML